jgi:DNA-binding transcriptional LysR family regulator
MIQLHQLEGFYRVVQAGGYARAARDFAYPITAPGVHAQVRKLEEALGVRLLERVAKDRMVPTRRGQTLLEFCAPFFEQLPTALSAVTRDPRGGRLRIEAGALEIQEVLPRWMRRVRSRLPEVEIELCEAQAPDYERLLRGQIDVIVDYQPRIPAHVSSRVVAVHRGFLVVPSDHRSLRRVRITLADLREDSFVALDPDQPHHALQLEALRTAGADPRSMTYVPSVTSILAFVAAGLGYSLVPWPTARGPVLRGIKAVSLRGAGTRFQVVASWRTRSESDPVLDAVLDLASEDSPRARARLRAGPKRSQAT